MSCQLPTDCLNLIDLRRVFHYTYCSKVALQRKAPYKLNTAKGDSSKKNIQLLTHLDVNDCTSVSPVGPCDDASSFLLSSLTISPQYVDRTDTPLSLSTFPSLSLFIYLPLSGAVLNSPTKPSVSVSTSPQTVTFFQAPTCF